MCPHTPVYYYICVLILYLRLQNIETALRLLVTWILEYMDKECPNVQVRVYAVIQ
jgi:hypothetical protein